jgi:hypothetical protein
MIPPGKKNLGLDDTGIRYIGLGKICRGRKHTARCTEVHIELKT